MYIIYKIHYYIGDEVDVIFIGHTTDKKTAKKLAKQNNAFYKLI